MAIYDEETLTLLQYDDMRLIATKVHDLIKLRKLYNELKDKYQVRHLPNFTPASCARLAMGRTQPFATMT